MNAVNHDLGRQLARWYETPLGQRLQGLEADYLKRKLFLYYGQTVVQLGALGWEQDFLDDCWLPNLIMLEDERTGADIGVDLSRYQACCYSSYESISITSEIADWLIIPHRLEYQNEWREVLVEAERILKPEGVLIILGFNPWNVSHFSQFITRGQFKPGVPFRHRLIGRDRIISVLNHLNFDADESICFYPRLSHLGENFVHSSEWSIGAVGYAIRARKRRFTMLNSGSPWRIRSLLHRPAPQPAVNN